MNTKNQIEASLNRVIFASLPYHADLTSSERENYLEELDANIEGAFLWKTTTDATHYNLSEMDALFAFQSTEGGMGVFLFEGTKPGDVNVMSLCSVLAFDRARTGLDALSRGNLMEAAVMAMTAQEVLNYGNTANAETELVAQEIRKKEKKTKAHSKARKTQNLNKYGQSKAVIKEEVEKILRENGKTEVVLVYQTPENLGVSGKISKTFKLFINNRLNVNQTTEYIYVKYVKMPMDLEKPPMINMKKMAIRDCINKVLSEHWDSMLQEETK